ncbi:MAG: hypothetical protein ACRELF_19435, partial [Gemmataceae bacterium]
MYAFRRNASPRHLTWEMTDAVVKHFYWLSVAQPASGGNIEAILGDNRIELKTRKVKQFALDLDTRLIDFGKPLRIVIDGKEQNRTLQPSLRTLCESMRVCGDPALARTCRIVLDSERK